MAQIDIYTAIKNDHEKLKPLLAQLVRAEQINDDQRGALIQEIRDELIPHSRAEEAIFYNSLRTIDGAKGIVLHSYEEHLAAESMLRSLQVLEKVDADFVKIAVALKDALEHHMKEEETEVFAVAKQVLVSEEARLMADAFERMKPEIREEGFMQTTLDLVANVMPQRFAQPLRNFLHKP